jgi:hypothetical protein
MRRARGEYLAFLDADDFMAPTYLESLYNAAKEGDLDIVIGEYDIFQEKLAKFTPAIRPERADIYEGGRIAGKNEHPDEIFQSVEGYVWNKLFRREFVVEKELCFLEGAKMFEDVYFVCTALSLAERIAKVDGVGFHHRVYSTSARNRLFRRYYDQVPLVYASIKDHLIRHGMYLPLQSSFMNLAASRIYKVYNLLWMDAKAEFYKLLHEEYAEVLGWSELAPDSLSDPKIGEFAANVAMFTYKEYTRREKRGIKIKLSNFAKRMKRRAFFTFKKKKKKQNG